MHKRYGIHSTNNYFIHSVRIINIKNNYNDKLRPSIHSNIIELKVSNTSYALRVTSVGPNTGFTLQRVPSDGHEAVTRYTFQILCPIVM